MDMGKSTNAAGRGLPEDIAALGFEEAFQALDALVAQLEGDGLTLEASLALYERGVALTERCNDLLAAAELRVREVDGDGRAIEVD